MNQDDARLAWDVEETPLPWDANHLYVNCRLLLTRDTIRHLEAEYPDPAILASVLLDEAIRRLPKRKGSP